MSNQNQSEETSPVNLSSIDDVRNAILTSKLTLQLSNNILNGPLKDEFIVTFFVLLNSVDLHPTTKVTFLCACFLNKLYSLAYTILDTQKITFVEVLKCLKTLDSKRQIKVLKRKLEKIQKAWTDRKARLLTITEKYLEFKRLNNPEPEKKDGDVNNNNNNNTTTTSTEVESKPTKKVTKPSKSSTSRGGRVVRGRGSTRGSRLVKGRPSRPVARGRGGVSSRGGRALPRSRSPLPAKVLVDEKDEEIKVEAPTNDAVSALKEDMEKLKVSVTKKLTIEEKRKRELTFEKRYNAQTKGLEAKIKELEEIGYSRGLSGNITRLFKKWFSTIPEKTLEYFALGQPKETWKEMADLLHLSPKDFKLSWFLEVMFGKAAPAGTSVYEFEQLGKEGNTTTVLELVKKYRPSYSFLRKKLEGDQFTNEIRVEVAKYEELSLIIWWLHEFTTVPEVQNIIVHRIRTEILGSGAPDVNNNGSVKKSKSINLAIGTLIEKTLGLSDKKLNETPLFKCLLQLTLNKLDEFGGKFSLDPMVATLGDCSGSMEVAIRLATIVGYLVTNLTPDASLSFFNTQSIEAPISPNSIKELFSLTSVVRATGGTSPAAGLWPFLDKKIVLKYLVVVTDEEENQNCQGMDFTTMYKKYTDEVSPGCKLIFVSFLYHNAKGQMVSAIKSRLGFEPLQFVLDRSSPDTTKLDHMLTTLSCESKLFKNQHELLCHLFSLFESKYFLKYMAESKSKFYTYSFNSEIVIDILKHLIKYYKNTLPLDGEYKHFGQRVFNQSNCITMIKDHLKRLQTTAQECQLNALEAFVTESIKTFNSLPTDKGIDFLSTLLESLDESLLVKPSTRTVENVIGGLSEGELADQGTMMMPVIDEFKYRDMIIEHSLTIPELSLILSSNRNKFIPLFLMLLNSIDLSSKIKINVLCSAFETRNYGFAHLLLYNSRYTFKEVSKAIQILDSQRQLNQLEKKLENAIKVNQERLDKIAEVSRVYLESKKALKDDKKMKDDEKKSDVNNNNNSTSTTTSTSTSATTTSTSVRGGRGGSRGGRGGSRGGRGGSTSRGGRGGSRGGSTSRGGRGGSRSTAGIKSKKEESKVEDNNNNNNEDKEKELKKKKQMELLKNKKSREFIFKARYESSINQMKIKIESLKKHQCKGHLSGNIIRIFKKWLHTFPQKTLEYFALGQSKETWREMADLLHLSPKDFQADWFLQVMFDDKNHSCEMIKEFSNETLTIDQLTTLIEKRHPPYSYVRKRISPSEFTDELKLVIASYEELSIVLWWYHELATYDVDQKIISRLLNNELITTTDLINRSSSSSSSGGDSSMSLDSNSITSCGTLIEKAMLFQQQGIPIFQDLLPLIVDSIKTFSSKISLPPPLLVAGDASASMDVAIRLSTIIGSLITSLTPNASLRFFNNAPIWAPINSKSLKDVFNVSNIIKGSGSTAPASALWPYYENKEKLKYIVLVTDEQENQLYNGYSFQQLYAKYLKEVSPDCRLVFVSFLGQNDEGQMIQEIREKLPNIAPPIQFKLDKNRPDVNKVDDLITSLSCHSESFVHQVRSMELMLTVFGERYYSTFVSSPENKYKYFKESYTLEILIHMLEVLSLYLQGDRLTTTKDEPLVESIDTYLMSRKNGIIDLLDEIHSHLKLVTSTCGYKRLWELINPVFEGGNAGNDHEIIQRFSNNLDHFIQSPEYKSKDIYLKEQDKEDNLSLEESEFLRKVNKQKEGVLVEGESANKIVTKGREKGHLNEFELDIFFKYIKDMKSLMVCSQVSKQWRKVSLLPHHWTRLMSSRDNIHDLDLVFLCDNTGSMGGEIEMCKQKIREIVDEITSIGSVSVRVGMVFYNDHPGPHSDIGSSQDVCQVFPFTDNIDTMRSNLASIRADGGHDEPEAMADGMYHVTKLDYKPQSTRVCILIGDAPPHGINLPDNVSGDSYPNGCPCGHDLIALTRKLITQLKVTIYSVLCRPNNYTFQIFSALAEMSEGRCVTIQDANRLASFIAGSAKEQIFLDTIAPLVVKEVELIRLQLPLISKEEAIYRASYVLRKQGITVPKLKDTNSSMNGQVFEKGICYQSIIKSANHTEYQSRLVQFKADQVLKKNIPKKKSSTAATTTTTTDDNNNNDLFKKELITINDIQMILRRSNI